MLGSLKAKNFGWVNKIGQTSGRSITDCAWFFGDNTLAVRYYIIIFQFGLTIYVDDCFGEVIGVFVVNAWREI
jgi:hypothetical protein